LFFELYQLNHDLELNAGTVFRRDKITDHGVELDWSGVEVDVDIA
jgi:hypothetical protein